MDERLNKVVPLLEKEHVDAFLVQSPANVSYLSGFNNEEAFLLISSKIAYLATDFRYIEQAHREASKGFKVILLDRQGLVFTLAKLARRHRLKRIGFESEHTSCHFYTTLLKSLRYNKGIVLKGVRGLIESLRVVKDHNEIAMLRRSAAIAAESFVAIKKMIRPGMSELDVQRELEYILKKRGSQKPAFDIIIASGMRSAMPHCRPDETKIRNNDLVLIDMGAVYKGYHSDLTRPIFLGKIPAFVKRIGAIVLEAQLAGLKAVRPGIETSSVDRACRQVIEREGYGRYFGHSAGHGVGREIHEAPRLSSKDKRILEPGMVVTVEPGIYLEGRFGIRIEDMALVTENGCQILTQGLDS